MTLRTSSGMRGDAVHDSFVWWNTKYQVGEFSCGDALSSNLRNLNRGFARFQSVFTSWKKGYINMSEIWRYYRSSLWCNHQLYQFTLDKTTDYFKIRWISWRLYLKKKCCLDKNKMNTTSICRFSISEAKLSSIDSFLVLPNSAVNSLNLGWLSIQANKTNRRSDADHPKN